MQRGLHLGGGIGSAKESVLYVSPKPPEFSMKRTTCTSEMLKRTTYKKNCQKGLPLSDGTSGQATRVTCHLGQIWQTLTVIVETGMLADGRRRRPPLSLVGLAASAIAGMLALA
jgi:hypothetical protein